MVSIDPFLIIFVLISFISLLAGMLLKNLNQPPVIAYIITGVIVGANGLSLISDTGLITHLGNLGVVLLLFFVGMEISIDRIISNWKIAIIGTAFQIIISVLAVASFGYFFDWPIYRIILFGFVISLSSTAVLIKILESQNKLKSKIGNDIISVLIAQDLAVVPMIIILSSLGSKNVQLNEIFLQFIGAFLISIIIYLLVKKKRFTLPFKDKLLNDHDFQLLTAFIICFGFALITGLFQLSTALGSFIGGMIVANAKETAWVHENLKSFKTLFVALFFVSIGMLIDISFIIGNMLEISILVFLVFITNTFINAAIFKLLRRSWRYSIYSGALLAQIGEFSFVLVSIGLLSNVITDFSYQMTISIIAISLILSPLWISLFSKLILKEDI